MPFLHAWWDKVIKMERTQREVGAAAKLRSPLTEDGAAVFFRKITIGKLGGWYGTEG